MKSGKWKIRKGFAIRESGVTRHWMIFQPGGALPAGVCDTFDEAIEVVHEFIDHSYERPC